MQLWLTLTYHLSFLISGKIMIFSLDLGIDDKHLFFYEVPHYQMSFNYAPGASWGHMF